MSDASPYGVHQHAAPGAVRQHTLVGEPIDMPIENQAIGASPATFSTAPYKNPLKKEEPPPLVQHESRRCSVMDCRNWAKRGSEWCRHHEPAATA